MWKLFLGVYYAYTEGLVLHVQNVNLYNFHGRFYIWKKIYVYFLSRGEAKTYFVHFHVCKISVYRLNSVKKKPKNITEFAYTFVLYNIKV